jgi:hypothetical protein
VKLVLLQSGLVDSVKQSPNLYSKFLGPKSAPVHSDLHHCAVHMRQTGLLTLTDNSPRCPAHGCSTDCGETSNSMWNYGIYNTGTHSCRALLEATCKFLLPMSSDLEAPSVFYVFRCAMVSCGRVEFVCDHVLTTTGITVSPWPEYIIGLHPPSLPNPSCPMVFISPPEVPEFFVFFGNETKW